MDKNPGNAARIMIGDRRHDLAGAIANNLEPIGVAWGYGSIEELEAAGASAIAQAPAELVDIADRFTL
jgi:phosphoglycolate phosphatase